MRAVDEPSIETERPTHPGVTRHDLIMDGLTDVVDGIATLLEEEIDYYRSKGAPPGDDRPTLPSVH